MARAKQKVGDDEIETPEIVVEKTDVDSEYTVPPVEAPEASEKIEIKGKGVNDGLTTAQKISRRSLVAKTPNAVKPPAGRIIKEGEPVRFEADELNYAYVIVRENTYQERYVFGSARPSYFLLYRAGQKVSKAALQNLG